MRLLSNQETAFVSGAGRTTGTGEYTGEYSGEYEGDTCRKNNNGYGNGAESGPPPGNSINNPQLLTWNSGKKGPR
jgi:hypothetical protein